MQPLEAVAVAGAGVAAGIINVVVGSGTLITFPVLLAVGYPPLTANVSNGALNAPVITGLYDNSVNDGAEVDGTLNGGAVSAWAFGVAWSAAWTD